MEIFHQHLLVRIVAAVLVANEHHYAWYIVVGENRGVVAGAAGEDPVGDVEAPGADFAGDLRKRMRRW